MEVSGTSFSRAETCEHRFLGQLRRVRKMVEAALDTFNNNKASSKSVAYTVTFVGVGLCIRPSREFPWNVDWVYGVDDDAIYVNYRDAGGAAVKSPFLIWVEFLKNNGFYLKALGCLPTAELRSTYRRSLLMGDYCYDPVSNIVVNTIWYEHNFSASKQATLSMANKTALRHCSLLRVATMALMHAGVSLWKHTIHWLQVRCLYCENQNGRIVHTAKQSVHGRDVEFEKLLRGKQLFGPNDEHRYRNDAIILRSELVDWVYGVDDDAVYAEYSVDTGGGGGYGGPKRPLLCMIGFS
ncbi:hypothetical protein PR202_gb17979 [Eleusine coracana subsp. coracana]|uniref:PIR2-like helical domain-containing protein n=1 Tax=Eleusine coracana subsp. coracana TaxID=191504 RepID=A0AAV5F1Z9_ELECO|nr:hypothetical protein PR202_gb17979 [Eleusine coracana subsp. coracana]